MSKSRPSYRLRRSRRGGPSTRGDGRSSVATRHARRSSNWRARPYRVNKLPFINRPCPIGGGLGVIEDLLVRGRFASPWRGVAVRGDVTLPLRGGTQQVCHRRTTVPRGACPQVRVGRPNRRAASKQGRQGVVPVLGDVTSFAEHPAENAAAASRFSRTSNGPWCRVRPQQAFLFLPVPELSVATISGRRAAVDKPNRSPIADRLPAAD